MGNFRRALEIPPGAVWLILAALFSSLGSVYVMAERFKDEFRASLHANEREDVARVAEVRDCFNAEIRALSERVCRIEVATGRE